jgi:mRNA interferase MazF
MYIYSDDNFNQWNDLKKKIHTKEFRPFFKQREVWWASVGQNVGDEQNGKNHNFERPVLIIQKYYGSLALVLPLTSKVKKGSYYYRKIVNNIDGSIILSQARVIDAKRLLRKIEVIDEESYTDIVKRYKELIN